MSEWKECKLGDFTEVQTGPFGSLLHAHDYVSHGTPSIMPINIGNRLNILTDKIDFVSDEDIDRLKRYTVRENDIVYSRRGDVEKCAFITKDQSGWLCGTGCLRIRFTSDKLLPKFCAYYLSTSEIRSWVLNNAVGTTMPNLNSKILSEVPLLVPEIVEQTAIAEVLGSLDDKIDLLHRQNKTLEQLAETLFRQWFVEEAEESCEVGTLEHIAIFNNGKSRPNEIENGEIPIYGGNGILGFTNQFNYEGISIIIGRVGAYCGSLYIENKPIWLSDNALLARSKQENDFYLFYFLKRIGLNSMAEGSSHPLLTQTLLKSIEIIIPPAEKEVAFENQAKDYWNKIYSNTNQIRTLTQLRDTLLPKLMTGEVRVNITKLLPYESKSRVY